MPYTLNVLLIIPGPHGPSENLRLSAFDKAAGRSDLLGSGLTDAEGRVTIAFDLAQFPDKPPDHRPSLFFRVHDGTRLVYSSLPAPLVDLAPGVHDFVIEIDLEHPVTETGIVTGRITDSEGSPLPNLRVRVVDCDMITDEELGIVRTDGRGAYLQRYTLEQAGADEIGTPDLRIFVLDDNGGEIARSPIVFNAPAYQVIDLSLPARSIPGRLPEWNRNMATTARVAQGRPPHEWTDENLEFLHFECGIDGTQLRFLRLDAAWAHRHTLQPSLCYALLRVGEPEDWDALLRRTPGSRRGALKEAQARRIIGALSSAQVEEFLQRMMQLAVDASSRDPPPDVSPSLPPIGALLAGTDLPAATQRRIVEVALSVEDHAGLWEAFERDPDIGEAAVQATRFVVDSYELLGRHAPTVRALPQGGSVLDLARLTQQDWLDVVRRIGADVADPAAHAETLAARVESAMPTAVVANRMTRRLDDAGEVQLGQFLLAHPRFDLRMPVDTFLRQEADLQGINDVPAFTRRLKLSARLARIAPDRNRYDWISALPAVGVDSAASAVALGKAGFMARATPIAAAAAPAGATPAAISAAVFDNAFALHAGAQFALARLMDALTVPGGVMATIRPRGEETDWTRIFGTLNACLCDECESIHGPAAYLVDLVRFLRSEASGTELPNLYEAARRRRPDIDTIALDCPNAHTPVPYVDLVNEILEFAVAPPSSTEPAPPPYQTIGDSAADRARLRAEPANLWAPAYAALASGRRLSRLPFVLAHEETLLYAGLCSIDMPELMGKLGLAADVQASAGARLGLSPEATALIAVPDRSGDALAQVWGEDFAGLGRVSLLLARSGLEPEELAAVLHSPWFAPLGLTIDRRGEHCQIDAHWLGRTRDGGGPRELTRPELEMVLDLLHRFLRLRAALGISAPDMSQVLAWRDPVRPGDAAAGSIDMVEMARLAGMARRLGVALGQDGLAGNDQLRRAILATEDERQFLATLHGGDPFERAGDAPVDLAFAERLLDDGDFLREAGLDLAELRYLIRATDLAPMAFTPTSESVDRWLQAIYDAMRRASTAMPDAGIAPAPDASPEPGTPEAAREQARQALMASARQAAADYLAGMMSLGPGTVAPLLMEWAAPGPGPERIVQALIRSTAAAGGNAVDAFVGMVMASGAVDRLPDDAAALAPDVRAAAAATLRRVLKAGRLVQLLDLSGAHLRSIALLPPGAANESGFLVFDGLPLTPDDPAQPLSGVRSLWIARRLQADIGHAEVSVFGLVESAHRAAGASLDVLAQVEAATGWGEAVQAGAGRAALEQLAGWLGVHTADRLRQPRNYARLRETAQWAQRRRLAPEELGRIRAAFLGQAFPPRTGPEPTSVVLREIARARYPDDAAWYTALTPAMDRLRTRRRDALLAYLLAYGGLAPKVFWGDADELYAYFLIDVQMGPCLQTSRIVQAHGALQLFVQRCLFAIEDRVELGNPSGNEHWRRWEWMKRYRVWEAARKVFLYPENWVEPELLDEKSPLYRELETSLLQDEIKQETAERAVRDYVGGLHDLARLEVMSLFEELIEHEGRKQVIVHVVARTATTPQVYFYRWRKADRSWTAWERLDLSINAEQVVLVVFNKRPMLVWPTLTEVRAGEEGDNPRRWDVGLAWSTREQGTWLASVSGTARVPLAFEHKETFALRMLVRDAHLCFQVFQERVTTTDAWFGGAHWGEAVGQFTLDACQGHMVATTSLPAASFQCNPGTVMLNNRFTTYWARANQLDVPLSEYRQPLYARRPASGHPGRPGGGVDVRILLPAAAIDYTVTPAHHFREFEAFQPFVYADSRRQFFISEQRSPWASVFTWHGLAVSTHLPWKRYRFQNFYHPYACQMLLALNEGGLDAFYRPGVLDIDRPVSAAPPRRFPRQLVREPATAYVAEYGEPSAMVWRDEQNAPYVLPVAGFDFDQDGAYAAYNWEAFFHIPLLIADRLGKTGHFADAQRWYHYIFDPTDVSFHGAPEKYWRVKPLFEEAKRWRGTAETLERMLSRLALDAGDVAGQVEAWIADPFNPHRLARLRPVAYMKTVVFKYLDNLLAWGDSLFARFSMESINEAMQIYILASRILGPRPVMLPAPPRERVLTVGEFFAGGHADELGNLLVDLETGLPPIAWPAAPAPGGELPPNLALYFCIPPNARLLGYWDRVDDRLLKIRHCQDLQGRSRQLPLFAPPIDPALLVRARAAGLDIEEVLSMAHHPALLSHRFPVQWQKAMEVCAELRSLGTASLSATEKMESEDMSLLRARQESALLVLVETVKQRQLDEAEEALAAMRASRVTVETRKAFYAKNAEHMRNASEETQLSNLREAHHAEMVSHGFRLASAIAHIFPQISATFPPNVTWGGTNLGNALDAAAAGASMIAAQLTFDANMAGIEGGHQRRHEEWLFQADLADKELAQIDRQILAAELRQSIAAKELSNHREQIQHSQAVLDLLRHKFTNAELQGWMAKQLLALQHEAYRMALELARRAEAAARFELGLTEREFTHVQFGHWDGARKGLLAGERLAMELRRMEVAYMDHNKRALEITKHISLRQLDATALMNLRVNGACRFTIPESVFDLDFPTHYFRCIKTVGLSVPCVVGPYGGVPATLTLERSDIKNAEGPPTPRNLLPTQAIATSSGQQDNGMFELNFRDERYLPFEGAGVHSTWTLRLPEASRPFDYDTISDVVVHLRYTAKDGGGTADVPVAAEARPRLLISLRHDFPRTWAALARGDTTVPALSLSKALFPFRLRDAAIATVAVHPYFSPATDTAALSRSITDAQARLEGHEPVDWALFAARQADWRGLKDCFLVVDYDVVTGSAPPPP